MSDDGANMGVLPNRALETIVGGKDQPKDNEKLNREGMYKKIMSQPDRYEDIAGEGGEGYENSTLWMAKQFLKILEEGHDYNTDELYVEMEKRNGPKDYDFTGFMVGYASNVARYCLKKPSLPNPAIVEI